MRDLPPDPNDRADILSQGDFYTQFRIARLQDHHYPPADGEMSAVGVLLTELAANGVDPYKVSEVHDTGVQAAESDIAALEECKKIDDLDFSPRQQDEIDVSSGDKATADEAKALFGEHSAGILGFIASQRAGLNPPADNHQTEQPS